MTDLTEDQLLPWARSRRPKILENLVRLAEGTAQDCNPAVQIRATELLREMMGIDSVEAPRVSPSDAKERLAELVEKAIAGMPRCPLCDGAVEHGDAKLLPDKFAAMFDEEAARRNLAPADTGLASVV